MSGKVAGPIYMCPLLFIIVARRIRYASVAIQQPWLTTSPQIHVSAAKAGVDALSNVLAVEEGPRGVRSNGLYSRLSL